MNNNFSSLKRSQIIQQLSSEQFDLLIIGGGITGAGIALDAASRGMKVALVEMQDFAAGTSSRSTKLIHGGLRYLKQLEFGLVREVGRERAILFKNAPHIVHPEKMLLPIVKGGSLGKLSTSIGLYLYEVLAGVKREERRVMLSHEETLKREPLLRNDILLGGGLYTEYRTDDARLVMEVMKTAVQHGACCVNYLKAKNFSYENEKATGIAGEDVLTGAFHNIQAKIIVNAAGPWVDELRRADDSLKGKKLHLTKGVHLVVPYEKLPLKQSVYFDVGDGRMLFAIPRDNITYIGTTDTTYKGSLENPRTTKEDVDYLMKAVNEMFPSVMLTEKDITSSWAGLRPLIHEEGKSPSELSRKDEIFHSHSGVISIAGGKLTGYRKMAERVTDIVEKRLKKENGKNLKPCHTDRITLVGGNISSKKEIERFIVEKYQQAQQAGLDAVQWRTLVMRYGTEAQNILEKTISLQYEISDSQRRQIHAELWYCIEHEMTATLSDFLIRRTGMLFYERPALNNLLPVIESEMAALMDWTEEEKNNFRKELEREYEEAVKFL